MMGGKNKPYADQTPEYKERHYSSNFTRHQKYKSWIAEYKQSFGCLDCGWNGHHAGLEFDHARGKKAFCLSIQHRAEKLITELLKCDVVCATCHRLREHERGWYGRSG